MVNFETIKMLASIEKLAALSVNGFMPLSKATPEDKDNFILYDDVSSNRSDSGDYLVVIDSVIDEIHRDAVSYLRGENYEASVEFEKGKPHVRLFGDDFTEEGIVEHLIIIEDGCWYFE